MAVTLEVICAAESCLGTAAVEVTVNFLTEDVRMCSCHAEGRSVCPLRGCPVTVGIMDGPFCMLELSQAIVYACVLLFTHCQFILEESTQTVRLSP